MTDLTKEIAAFDAMRSDLEKNHNGKFVIFHEATLIGAFDTFEAAASDAVRRFGSGPFLIRQVGDTPPILPASVLYPTRKPELPPCRFPSTPAA